MTRRQHLALSAIASLLLSSAAAADRVTLLSVPGFTGSSSVEGYAGWFVLSHFNLKQRQLEGSPSADAQDFFVGRSSADGDLPDELSQAFYLHEVSSIDLSLAVRRGPPSLAGKRPKAARSEPKANEVEQVASVSATAPGEHPGSVSQPTRLRFAISSSITSVAPPPMVLARAPPR